MHCDTLMGAYNNPAYQLLHNEMTMVDFARMKQGGQMAQFFAMFLMPAGAEKFLGLDKPIDDDDYIAQLSAALKRNVEANNDIIAMATNADEMLANWENGKMSAILSIEDGKSINGDIDKIQKYYDLGVRAISLTWNFPNCIGFPNSTDPMVMSKGLTDFGKDAVIRMQELGILVDVSHLSDGGFMDVAKLATKPFVATHSNCRALGPHQRNLTDDMIRLMADKGGVSGLNYGPEFLNADVTIKDSTAELIVKHIKHFINVGGVDCVGLGSDFDGIGGSLEIDSPGKVPVIFDLMRKEGLSEDIIEKVAYKNVLRVMREAMM